MTHDCPTLLVTLGYAPTAALQIYFLLVFVFTRLFGNWWICKVGLSANGLYKKWTLAIKPPWSWLKCLYTVCHHPATVYVWGRKNILMLTWYEYENHFIVLRSESLFTKNTTKCISRSWGQNNILYVIKAFCDFLLHRCELTRPHHFSHLKLTVIKLISMTTENSGRGR